jgi:uncharacterized membrane protein (UPF0127 family)
MTRVLLMLIALLTAVPAAAQGWKPYEPLDPAKAQSLPTSPLAIESSGQTHRFQVELAVTDKEHAVGLMHRDHLAPGRGMLFQFKTPKPTKFWMRNTFIPLDIIFTDVDGVITYIAADVQPHVESPTVGPGWPSASVLELPAGTAARLGIKTGDRLRHPIFAKPKPSR